MASEAFWKSVARRLAAGTPLYVAMVVANTRHSPGTLGACLAVDANGNVDGTVGGGIMEVHVTAAGRNRLLAQPGATPELQRLIHRGNAVEHASGLICAGEQTNLNVILQPQRDLVVIQRFVDALADQSTRAASLVVNGRGVMVLEDVDDKPASAQGLRNEDGGWSYSEPSVNPRRLAIVGAGHCARALARLAVDVGYWVEVFDTRADAFGYGVWPEAARLQLLRDHAELATLVRRKPITTVVVMTAMVSHDVAALAAIAPHEFRWLGVMGSTAKIHEIRRSLRERGISPQRVDAIRGPIGLPMKSDTPPEIAVSVMAQLLADTPASTAALPDACAYAATSTTA